MSWALLNDDRMSVTHAVPGKTYGHDVAFIGLSSPTAPVSNYAYTGFAALAEAYADGRLGAVFIDQPSPGAIRSGAKTALDDYSRLATNFYSKRPDYGRYVGDPKFRAKVHEGIALYLNEPLPLLAPMYPWGNVEALSKRIPQGHHLHPVDPTGAYWSLAELITLPIDRSNRAPMWVIETAYAKPPKIRETLSYPIITTKSPATEQDFDTYAASSAVIEGDAPIKGWWTPTAAAALLSGAAFIGGPNTAVNFASPWMDVIESMGPTELVDLVRRQTDNLRRSTWSMKSLADFLHDTAMLSVSSEAPGTQKIRL